jgi:hypothetical protein
MRESDREELTREQQNAREAVRALHVPEPDPEFRAQLRSEFTAGRFDVRPRRLVHLRWWERESTRWAAVSIAAAATLVAVLMLNQGPAWRVSSSHGEGIAVVDGRPVPIGHTTDFNRWLRAGATVEIPDDSDLEIHSPGLLAVELSPGTRFTIPDVPGRWFRRAVRAEVSGGEARITTASKFHGAHLEITTPEAKIEVTGTTLAVICEPEGTCVCVLEGVVRVGGQGQPMVGVAHGHRRYVFADGRPAVSAEIRSVEQVKLTEFRESRRAALERAAR